MSLFLQSLEPFAFLALFGFGGAFFCYGLRRFLLARGHGPKLDRLAEIWERHVEPIRFRLSKGIALGLLGASKALNSAPLFIGSKVGRENADRMIEHVKRIELEPPGARRRM